MKQFKNFENLFQTKYKMTALCSIRFYFTTSVILLNSILSISIITLIEILFKNSNWQDHGTVVSLV